MVKTLVAILENKLGILYHKLKTQKLEKILEKKINQDLSNYDVVLVCRDYLTNSKSGISRHYFELARGFKNHGLEPIVICEYKEGDWLHSDVAIRSISPKKIGPVNQALPGRARMWINAVIIEVYNYPAIPMIMPIVGAQNVLCSYLKPEHKTMVTLHSPYQIRGKNDRETILANAQRNSLYDAKTVIANSNTIKKYFGDYISKSALLIKHGVQVSQLAVTRKEKIIWVGFPTVRKGIKELIQIVENCHPKYQFHIVCQRKLGNLNFLKLLTLAMRKKIILQSNIPDEQLFKIMSESKAMLSTSKFESFGLSAVEAAKFSTPLISLRCEGLEETIPPQYGSTFFDSTKELTQYLYQVDDSTLKHNGIKSQKFVEENYNVPRMLDKFIEALNSL